jgi:hypothetical protein
LVARCKLQLSMGRKAPVTASHAPSSWPGSNERPGAATDAGIE